MFSSTSSQKRGGAAHSRSSDNFRARNSIITVSCRVALLFAGLSFYCTPADLSGREQASAAITKAAANRCDSKLNALEKFADHHKAWQKQTTQFSEDEVNSYLALDLSSKYQPSLKALTVTFEEGRLQCVADIDFDRLGAASDKILPKLFSFMFSGVHKLTARGQLLSGNGKASFRLEQARFDNSTLPKALVEEIITAVGRKQTPPFDPLQPSQLFYDIDKVDVHSGYILVYQ
jgi:hypothetical protein